MRLIDGPQEVHANRIIFIYDPKCMQSSLLIFRTTSFRDSTDFPVNGAFVPGALIPGAFVLGALVPWGIRPRDIGPTGLWSLGALVPRTKAPRDQSPVGPMPLGRKPLGPKPLGRKPPKPDFPYAFDTLLLSDCCALSCWDVVIAAIGLEHSCIAILSKTKIQN